MSLHAHQCNGRRAGDAPVFLGVGHDRCALTHVISNSRGRGDLRPVSRMPVGTFLLLPRFDRLTHARGVALPSPLPRAFSFDLVRKLPERARQSFSDQSHRIQALSFAVADDRHRTAKGFPSAAIPFPAA